MITRTLSELAAELGGEVVGDGTVVLKGVAGIREAQPGDVTFLANARYEPQLAETRASAVICAETPRHCRVPQLRVKNPYLAFTRAVRVFRPDLYRPVPGIHPSAVISRTARVGAAVSIGPNVVIEDEAVVGDRTIVMACVYVGERAVVGEDCWLYPHVTLREECTLGKGCILHSGVVVGADGFGYALDEGRYHKIPQVGNVVIGDNVEVGANTTIDRATTGSTRVGDGTKIDNLVQIGHNVVIGRHCIIVAQTGIAGSTELEDYVTLAGQVGVNGHIRIGTHATVAAQSGVVKSVPPNAVVMGYPAMIHQAFKRLQGYVQRLPQLFQRTKDLETRVGQLERDRVREEVR
jgi:UDP-3-O-[3-hydroxymyristoyl] glucosamine N-acyltransferase